MEKLINQVRKLIENIETDINHEYIQIYNIDTKLSKLFDSLPKDLLLENKPSLVLSEDTYLELGSHDVPSCRLLIPVGDPNLIVDGKIKVIGPDISKKLPEKIKLPFAQLIFIYSRRAIDPDLYRKIQIHLSVFNIINGFMIRVVPRKFWIRISKDLVKSGFNFEQLGKFLIFHIKNKFLEISKIEIIFITTSEEKINDLEKISNEIQQLFSETTIKKKLREIEKGQIPQELLQGKKRFDCDYEWSCNECEYNEICDEIIDIVRKMKKYKEEHNL